TLYERFDQLSAKERGELFGHAIGKYGVDAVACTLTGAVVIKGSGYAVKGASAIRNLRKANRACILEEMAASKTNKKIISSSALKHAAERDNYFKNVRIHWDKQNKHIPGKHNFEVGRGTILIESNELELLIKQHAGKGQKVTGSLGEAGYKERVDFGKIIGEYAQEIKGEPTKYLKTSKGIITYAKDGSAHVYPTNPNATFN
ncbi:MAG: polymorphic toxin type 50 domain-containing protein, partial [Parachlamydiaceae bacterium]